MLKVVIEVHDAQVKAVHVRIGEEKRRNLWIRRADVLQKSHFRHSPPLSVHTVLDHQWVRPKLIWLQNVEAFCIFTRIPKKQADLCPSPH